jgi:probable HAF family extracellular repeat protein
VGQRAVLWRDGQIIDLGVLDGAVSSFAYAINDRGQIVGISWTASGELGGFLWQDGVMRDPGVDGAVPADINNHGQVVGALNFGGPGEKAFVWRDGVVTRLASPGQSSRAIAINDQGEIVGIYHAGGDEGSRAVRWYRGAMTELGTLLKGNASGVAAINARGQIVGSANVAPYSMEERPFLWWRGVMHDLTRYGVPATMAYSMANINDRGQILAGDMLYTPA